MKAPAKRTVKTDRGRATRDRAVAKKSQDKPRRGVATIRERQVPAGRERTRTARGTKVARERSFAGGRAWQAARDRNVTIVNTWRDNRFAGAKYKAFRDYRKVYRDRAWYHRHYTRIIFMMGGWWYWNAGYWYPAWGYSRYSYYPYAGPIYTATLL
jgi:hypothetical protein